MKKPDTDKPLVKLIPLLVRGVAPAAAITLGLSPATTVSAPGDLDPSFGDFGRVAPIMDFAGEVWSAQALGVDGTLIAGGEEQGSYSFFYGFPTLSSFVGELAGDGSPISSFVPDPLPQTEVLDSALLPDGSLIAVGQSLVANHYKLTVAKLSSSGTLDASFGTKGIFQLDSMQKDHKGASVTVDPDGRIVVAGAQASPAALLVVRLQANGVLDDSFGTSGVYTGPSSAFGNDAINIVGTGSGYRVSTSDCAIIGLTAAGKPDTTFGSGGTANAHAGHTLTCNVLVAQPDGRLLAAGADGAHGYATRLLANGAVDPTFSSTALAAGTSNASALAVAGDGSGAIVVAGFDPASTDATVVMRLQANGQLDTGFGRAGTTLIDLPSDTGTYPVVHDLLWHPDGSVVAVGGDYVFGSPFAVRLLGTGGADVPGVVGATQANVTTNEQSSEVIVKVRRTGGAAGAVSVAYQTQVVDANSSPATSALDFGAVSGRLTWNDGDTAEQEIHVPILADSITEESEYFHVQLTDPQGGAGLGTRNATVEIQPDGSPFGQFEVSVDTPTVSEGAPAQVSVIRNFYTSGAVSVILTPVAGTASAGSDFDPTPVTVSWADGEGGPKTVKINIPADLFAEPNETFSLKLSNPTGGALLGPRSTADVTIAASAAQPPSSGGGGGSLGMLGLLLLGAVKFLQLALSPGRRRRPSGG